MSRITDFCICIYVFGCKLSLFRLCGSDCGITAVDDITIGIPCAAFCFHIAHISFAISGYLFCLSVIVLARLCVLGTAMCTGDSYVYWGQLCLSNRWSLFFNHESYVSSVRLEGVVLFVILL